MRGHQQCSVVDPKCKSGNEQDLELLVVLENSREEKDSVKTK